MFDVICFGELLIDFICSDPDCTIATGVTYTKNAGGAPANVAAGVAKFGGKSAFIGKVGSDSFGRFLAEVLKAVSVDVSQLVFDPAHKTSLAFVSLTREGERDFEFYRDPGADVMLDTKEINFDFLRKTKIFHFGSISFIAPPIKNTLLRILEFAKQNKLYISYDPNIRLNLWKNASIALEWVKRGFGYADCAKLSVEEALFIAQKRADLKAGKTSGIEIKESINYIHSLGPKIVFATAGAGGSFVSNGNEVVHVPGYSVKTVDTTGAGDAFTAACLCKLSGIDIHRAASDIKKLAGIARFANKAGAIVTTKKGAINALPTLYEIEKMKGESR